MGNDGNVLWKKKLCGDLTLMCFTVGCVQLFGLICSAVLCVSIHTVLFS